MPLHMRSRFSALLSQLSSEKENTKNKSIIQFLWLILL